MKKLRKRLALLLVTAIVASTSVAPVYASDYQNHWASKTITKWQSKGLLTGYEDGTFRPDSALTRAEFASLLVRMFGYTDTEEAKSYTDVPAHAWYSSAVDCVSHVGLMYDDGTKEFRPDEAITREEASYALAKAFKVTGENEELEFVDESSVSKWAQDAVEALHTSGYLHGTPEGYLYPQSTLTRAEFLTMTEYLTSDIINDPGTYTESVEGNLVINTRDVVLKDMTIEGDLYLGAGIGDGDIYLENITVKGQVFVEGGGENSIKSKNSKYYNKFNVSAENPVRIVIEGDAVKVEAYPGTNIILTGSFEDVIVSPGVEMSIKDATVDTIIVSPSVDGNTQSKPPVITIDESTKVSNVQADSAVELKGDGKVENLTVNAEGVTIEKKPGNVVMGDKDLTVDVGGETLKPESGGSGGSGGSSGDGGGTTQPQEKYRLTGQVLFEGEPAQYASVNVFELPSGDKAGSMMTDETGKFSFYLKSGKSYSVEAWVETEEGTGYFGSCHITINSNTTQNVELKQMPTVNFTIVDKNNLPVPNVKIVPIIDGQPDGWSYTNNLGLATRYMWDADGTYGYNFYIGETLVHQIPEEVIADEDLNVKLDVKLKDVGIDNTISGKIINKATGEPESGVEVGLFIHTVEDEWGGSTGHIESTTTDEQGNYTFTLSEKKIQHYQVSAEYKDEVGNHFSTERIDARFTPYMDLEMKQNYGVTINTVDKNGKPLSDIEVGIRYSSGGTGSTYTQNGSAELYSFWTAPGKHVLFAQLGDTVMAHPLEMVEGTYNYEHTFTFDIESKDRIANITLEESFITVGNTKIEVSRIGIYGETWGRFSPIENNKATISIPGKYPETNVFLGVEDVKGNIIYREPIVFDKDTFEKHIDLNAQPKFNLSGQITITTNDAIQVTTGAAISINLGSAIDMPLAVEVASQRADSEGNFTQSNLIKDRYTLRTSYTLDGVTYSSTDSIWVGDNRYIHIDLLPEVTNYIDVVDQDGNPISELDVEFSYESGMNDARVQYRTDSKGRIVLKEGVSVDTLVNVDVFNNSRGDYTPIDKVFKIQENGEKLTLHVNFTPWE